jgi:hypothetical protein
VAVFLFAGGKVAMAEIWGERETKLWELILKTASEKGNNVFLLPDSSQIPEDDGKHLVLVEHAPNSYQSRFSVVYKLQTKGFRQGKSVLIPASFPKAAAWKEDLYFLPNGTPVPDPQDWVEATVDESNINLEDLLATEDVEVASPWKKQKK